MYSSIKDYCNNLITSFDSISQERKLILQNLVNYIKSKIDSYQDINLVYVCTHNSRRSHFGQVWAAVAASYYGIQNVKTFSGGTEETAFNINAINALKRIGFEIMDDNFISNPKYSVYYSDNEFSVCFSKVYNNKENPSSLFAAIMTCSDAELNCPYIPGVELRIGITYNDPKEFDNTPFQDAKYDERSKQIALEAFYVFSKINK